MKNFIKEIFEKYGFNLSEKQIEQFAVYMDFLLQENQKYNLTAITDEREVVIKHFVDSVLPLSEISQNASVIDVGTGAGFPGVPLKILRPDIKLTLLDSLQKRINFLGQLLTKLEIDNVDRIHSRAEDYALKMRENFDVALSRAVAGVPTLSEYLIPFVKVGGKVLMYKGSSADEELKAGEKAILTLGGKVEKVVNFSLKEVESERNIVVIKKINKTDKKYPRGKNLPKTKPILK